MNHDPNDHEVHLPRPTAAQAAARRSRAYDRFCAERRAYHDAARIAGYGDYVDEVESLDIRRASAIYLVLMVVPGPLRAELHGRAWVDDREISAQKVISLDGASQAVDREFRLHMACVALREVLSELGAGMLLDMAGLGPKP